MIIYIINNKKTDDFRFGNPEMPFARGKTAHAIMVPHGPQTAPRESGHGGRGGLTIPRAILIISPLAFS